jgi:organic radical activating enzyme
MGRLADRMSNPYKTRAGGATVTVFVPYDCGNHCPFCINKKEYADCSTFSLDAILKSIRTMDEITPQCDFVFTGGEPFANLPALQQMLDAIPATHKIYINTTFPVQKDYTADEMIAFTEKNRDKITCINISRHLVKYVEESPDEVIGRITCPTRINCVLFRDYPTEKLAAYVDRFRKYNIPIQFRYDYTETTPENLYEESHDKILHDLKELFSYRGLDGCRMRNGYHFEYKGLHMTYHKTLPYSTIVEIGSNGVTYDILYDILIKQTGEIHSDWTGVKLDVDAYRKVVYEPYDLRVLDGTIDF